MILFDPVPHPFPIDETLFLSWVFHCLLASLEPWYQMLSLRRWLALIPVDPLSRLVFVRSSLSLRDAFCSKLLLSLSFSFMGREWAVPSHPPLRCLLENLQPLPGTWPEGSPN